MRDRADDDSIDGAYRAALDLLANDTDAAAVRRRRDAVLEAVDAACAPAPRASNGRPALASNEPRWRRPATWWGGAAAACVIAGSALLTMHLVDEPGADVGGKVADAGSALAPAQGDASTRPAPAAQAPPPTRAAPAAKAPLLLPGASTEVAQTAVSRRSVVPAPAAPAPARRSRAPEGVSIEPALSAETAGAADARWQASAEATPRAAAPPAAPPPTPADADRLADASVGAEPPSARPAATGAMAPALPARARSNATSAQAAAKAHPAELLAAAASGRVDDVRLSLARTAPDAERDADGRTALALAVLRSDAAMVRLLLDHGADPQARDRFGQTPQGYATERGVPAVMDAFERPARERK